MKYVGRVAIFILISHQNEGGTNKNSSPEDTTLLYLPAAVRSPDTSPDILIAGYQLSIWDAFAMF
jgi:hypothetical protein